LFDTLFRPTAVTASIASAPPVREPGTHSRAGNAMSRTRAALLDGARRAVQASGTKITMAQVASSAGVAKATLYNHFRTREAVLAALVQDEVETLVREFAGQPLPDALAGAAASLSRNPVLRALAALDPATLAALARIDPSAAAWRIARDGVTAALTAAGRAGTDTVLRWLASHLVTPAAPAAIADDVAVLVAGLPDAPGQAARTA
jgi:AcrR family transcriptional regulator